MKKIQSIITLFILMFLCSTSYAKTDIEYILDISGSMVKVSGGDTQINIARKALVQSLQGVSPDTQVALRVYGHRVEQTNKAASCQDTELLIPFAPVNIEQIKTKANALIPKGYTPIAYSLEQSRNDFNTANEAQKVIILLSDGEETCDGDPVGVVKKMIADGFKVVVNTVGFNVDSNTRKQLESIAAAGGGQYFDAQGAAGLQDALTKATQSAQVINKTTAVYGNETRGGDSYETATAIKPNVEYKLDHHQKARLYDYFYVDLKAGQELVASVSTLQKGVYIDQNNNAKVNDSPYAGIQIHDNNRNRISVQEIIGGPNTTKEVRASTPSDARYYILLGSGYDNMNKDAVTFTYQIISRGDLGGEIDAGDNIETALPIQYQRYPKNYVGKVDLVDTFKFEGKKGDRLTFGFIPDDSNSPMLEMLIHDSYKQQIYRLGIPGGQGKKSDPFLLPSDGVFYLVIRSNYGIEHTSGYTFELIKEASTGSE